MLRAGTAFLDIEPNTRGLAGRVTSALRPALGAASSSGSRMSSILTGAFAGIGKAAAIGFAAVGTAAAGAIGFGVKIAADLEQARIGFTNILGSAEKADSFIRELQAFAARTPFEFPGLQRAAGRFVGAGIAAERVIPIMTAVGDSIAAVGGGQEQIDQATRALVQMQQKGRVTGEEMLQLTEAGISSWGTLAAQMGVSIPEAQKKVSAGQVEVNTLMEGLIGYAGPLAKVKGQMDAQAGSLKGMLSTLKDVISLNLAEAAAPLVTMLKANLPLIQEAIGGLLTTFGPVIATLLEQVFGVVKALLPALQPLAKVFGVVIERLGAALIPVLEALAPIAGELATSFGELLIALIPLLRPLGQILVAVAPLIPIFVRLLELIVRLAVSAILPLIGYVTRSREILIGLGAVIVAVLLPGFIAWAAAAGAAAIATIAATAPVIAIGLAIAGLVAGIVWLVKNWDVAWKAITNALAVAWETIKSVASRFGLILLAVIFPPAALIAALVKWREPIFRFFRELPGNIVGWIGDLGELLIDVGQDLIRGLWEGIKSMGSWIKDKISGWLTSWIPGPVKKVFGIGSPSKLFAGYGQDLIRGLAVGMSSASSLVDDAVADLAARVSAPIGAPALVSAGAGTLSAGAVAGARAGVVWTGDVIVQGSVVSERELVDAVRSGLYRVDRHNVGTGIRE